MAGGKKRTTAASTNRAPAQQLIPSSRDSEDPSPNSSLTRLSRQREKDQLSSLNDRLASYIERVRNLEAENQRLQLRAQEADEQQRQERSEVAGRYEMRVDDLRKQNEALIKERARLDFERTTAVSDTDSLRDRLAKTETDLKFTQSESTHRYEQIQDLSGRLNNAENLLNTLTRENQAIKEAWEGCQREIETLRRQNAELTLLREELEHRVSTYKEELSSSHQAHIKEVNELRRHRQSEVSNLSPEAEMHYQRKFQQQLRDMREDFDARITHNRAELEELYTSKLAEYKAEARKHEETVRELKIANGKLIHDYKDLLDLKVQMDTELQAYQKLLECEEDRLHIPPVVSAPTDESPTLQLDLGGSRHGTKRRRTTDDVRLPSSQIARRVLKATYDFRDDICIEEVCPAGTYVRIKNNSAIAVPIGGWMIKAIGSEKEVTFKFASTTVMEADSTITVWSNTSNHEHTPPIHIVMKSQAWPQTSDEALRVELLNEANERMAWYELSSDWDGNVDGEDSKRSCITM